MNSNKNKIFNSISFIESRLSDELNINELAEQAFFSKPHYQRLFQAVVGEPVMEYIRKRRLQRAGIMLCNTNASVLDIALQFGYTSHEGFSRAFKEYFNMPPLQYRKRYSTVKPNQYREEVMNMIPNEARKNIAQYADDIANDWELLIAELEKWIAPAKNEIAKDKRTTGGMKVSFQEWSCLTERISSAISEIRLFAETTDVYELYDKISALMKVLDDINFQMNLLRFLTGIEWSRMGEHGVPFTPILEGITAVCDTELKRNESAIKLISEINKLIQMEIKREAISCTQKAVEVIREIVNEGASLTEKINSLVVEMGVNGRGFAIIARETEKVNSYARDAEFKLQQLVDEVNIKDIEVFSTDDFASINTAIMQLADCAYKMNLNAFNAAVETARAGEENISNEYADGVRNYAYHLQRTFKTCESLNKDSVRLVSLLRNEGEKMNDDRFKLHDDIIFQAGFLTTQLSLESERTGREDLRSLSHEFQKAIDDLRQNNQEKNEDVVKLYSNKLSVLMERGNSTATAAGNYGAGIAYIIKEFNRFALKVNSEMKP